MKPTGTKEHGQDLRDSARTSFPCLSPSPSAGSRLLALLPSGAPDTAQPLGPRKAAAEALHPLVWGEGSSACAPMCLGVTPWAGSPVSLHPVTAGESFLPAADPGPKGVLLKRLQFCWGSHVCCSLESRPMRRGDAWSDLPASS